MGSVEIARQQPCRGARGTAHQFEIGFGDAREMIVDDHRRDRGDQPDRGGEQRLGDTGCDHGKIGGLRLRDPDKAVHDAPHRAEQPDKRRGRADGREQSHAEPDAACFGARNLGEARCGALLDAAVGGYPGRQPRIAAARNADKTPDLALALAPSANCASASERESAISPSAEVSLPRATASSIIFAMKIVQVTSEAKASPIITALTRTSADRNIDHGDNSRSVTVVDFSDLLSAGVAAASGAGAGGTAVDSAGT